MPINFDNIQITGGLNIEGLVVPPIVGDPYWANVSLLMNNTTTNNQTNNTFSDGSTNNYTITRNGTVTQGSFTPFTVAANTSYSTSTNGGSAYFPGSATNNLTAGTTSSFNFLHNSSALFTAEFWIYRVASNNEIIFSTNNGGSASIGAAAYFVSGNKISLFITRGVAASPVCDLTSASSIPLNTWTHVAITYNQSLANSNAKIYINGVLDATGNKTANAPSNSNATTALNIGGASTFWLNGYLSSFRIVNSVVYSSNFTPSTTPLTAIANTSLLMNFTNAGIFDGATKNNLTTVGDTKVSTTQAKFGNASVYFDGTGDYLITSTTSGFNIGQNDFTVECWVRPLNVSGVKGVLGNHPSLTGGGYGIYLNNNIPTGTILVNGSATASYATGPAISANTWSHLAFVKSSGNTKMYVNGVGGTAVSSSYNSDNSSPFYIGAFEGSYYLFGGYIQDVRLTVGVARYTSNFTPPTEPLPTY